MSEAKSKKVQYLLLLMVVGIWGTVAYRMFSYSGSSNYKPVTFQSSIPIVEETQAAIDSFMVTNDYPDPFGAKKAASKNKTRRSSSGAKKAAKKGALKEVPEEKVLLMPEVIYHAYSLNNNLVTRVKVKIDKKSYTLKSGDEISDIKLLLMEREKIRISWQGKEIDIPRKKS